MGTRKENLRFDIGYKGLKQYSRTSSIRTPKKKKSVRIVDVFVLQTEVGIV